MLLTCCIGSTATKWRVSSAGPKFWREFSKQDSIWTSSTTTSNRWRRASQSSTSSPCERTTTRQVYGIVWCVRLCCVSATHNWQHTTLTHSHTVKTKKLQTINSIRKKLIRAKILRLKLGLGGQTASCLTTRVGWKTPKHGEMVPKLTTMYVKECVSITISA